MATTKTYNEVDCKKKLLYIEIGKGEYGGYRQHLLVHNLNEIEVDFYICTKCNGLLRYACQVGVDQNLVCETCVLKGEISQPMIKSRKKIPEIGAKCPLVSRGCVWKGIIGEVDVHLDVCNELIVKCLTKCGCILKRSELMNHYKNECLKRKVNCMHCKIVFQYKEIDNHLTICPELPLHCPNECLQAFLRKEMNSHIKNDCPNTIVHCINECGLKMKRRKLLIHCKNECQLRIVNCEYCGASLRFKEFENHYEFCLEFPLVCPNECQRILMRKELESHIGEECPNTLVACPYKEMRCDVVTKRCGVQQHEKLFESNHLKITVIYYSDKVKSMETLFRDKENLLADKVKTVEAQMREKERANERLKNQLLYVTDINSKLLDKNFQLLDENNQLLDKNGQLLDENERLLYENAIINERWSHESFPETKDAVKPMHLASKTTVRTTLEPEPEVLPAKRYGDLKIGFLHIYIVGLISEGWKRNLVALSDGEVYIYNTARDYGKGPAEILHMSGCDGMNTHRNDKSPKKPAVPSNISAENGFVLRVAGKLHYFVADTMEESQDWLMLLEESKERDHKKKPTKRGNVELKPTATELPFPNFDI